jgi:glycerol-3-phosphate acyltransferase PlsX
MPKRSSARTREAIVAVDASGGDYAPHEIVKGAIKAAQEYDVQVVLVGKKDILSVLAGRHLGQLGMAIVDAPEVITFDESPSEAVPAKPNSSIVVGTNLVKEGKASAFISAGSTGAVFYAAFVALGKTEGIDRPAIATIINVDTLPVFLIDSGANADCRAQHLVQFAQLGTTYATEVFGMESPSVGLLNMGAEAHKGNKLAKESFELLKQAKINFVGNVEGHDISRGTARIVVTDGFTGNIVLKALEGLGEAFIKLRHAGESFAGSYQVRGRALLSDVGIGSLANRIDYRQYGGASLLGLNGNIIIAHGRSRATAIKNAIGLGKRCAERDLWRKIKEAHYEQTSPG